MKENIRFIDIQLPHYSKIIEALIASRNKEENIDNVEIFLYMGKERRPLKIILRPKDESLEFDVTTPYDTRGRICTCIGKAQISKAIPIGIPINSANLIDSYSLSIEIVEQPTNFAESFIERIKVLKDELGVAKESLRLTGDIFHILPNAKKGFNIIKNKINFEHFDSPKIDSLYQKENKVGESKLKHIGYNNQGFVLLKENCNLKIIVNKQALEPIISASKGNDTSLKFDVLITGKNKRARPLRIVLGSQHAYYQGVAIGTYTYIVTDGYSNGSLDIELDNNDSTDLLFTAIPMRCESNPNNYNLKDISFHSNLMYDPKGIPFENSIVFKDLNGNIAFFESTKISIVSRQKNKEEAIQTLKEASFNSKSEEKNSECACCKNNELSELFEKMRELLNKLPITQIESLSQIDIDTKNGNKPSGYTSRIKTIYPDLNPSPIKKDKFSELENKSEAKEEDHYKKESLTYDLLKNLMSKNQDLSRKSKTIHGDGSRANYKEQKVFVSSHALESDAVRAVEEWTRKLNKNSNNGDLFTTRGIKLINFGFIHGFKAEAEESANGAYATHRIKTYSIYANIKINTTNIKENKLTVTEEDIMAAVICTLERLSLKKDENKEMDKERLFFQAIRPGLSPLELKDMIKNDVSTPKATETIIVPFSIVLKDIIAYNHLLEYTEQYKATFRFKDKEFRGEIKSMNIQYPFATTVNTRRASPSSIKAIVNIAIIQECKDTIDNLKRELDSQEICVGSLGFNSITRSAGALYTIKSYAEKEDRQTINIDMSLNTVVELERFSHLVNKYANLPFTVSTDPFTVSTANEQAARIIYCADTEEEAVSLIMNIKDKLKNRFIENKSKQFNFSIYNNYINVEIKSFSSDNTILRVQDIVLVASRDLGKYFVVAKLQ